jgi:hypothetical protein
MLFQELFTLAVTKAEEQNINLIERHLVGEAKISFTNQSFMHITHEVACVRFAVSKDNLSLWVVQQKANQLATSVTGCT